MTILEQQRALAPWEHETHDERARRVCAEADRLQLLWELRCARYASYDELDQSGPMPIRGEEPTLPASPLHYRREKSA